MNMTIQIKEKCIFEGFADGEFQYLIHQVNMQKVMGSGIAKEIKERFPHHFTDYINEHPKFGRHFVSPVGRNKFVVGVYGQNDYGTSQRQTNYIALMNGLVDLFRELSITRSVNTVGIPYGVGCGLGGGDWEIVEQLLIDLSEMFSVNIIIYKKN